MTNSSAVEKNEFIKNMIEAAVRLGLLLLVVTWCFKIISPFIIPVIWAVIISVAIYPLFLKLRSLVGGSNKIASVLYTLIALTFLITPTIMISSSIIDTTKIVNQRYESGELDVPAPDDSVKEWPVIGEKVHAVWTMASEDLAAVLKKYEVQVKEVGKAVVGAMAGGGRSVLLSIISIIISGIFVANAASAYRVVIKIFSRLTNNECGQSYADLSIATIRSVAQGVLGIALIQSVFAGLGMFVMDVPAWGLWTVMVLVLAIAQLPPILVLGFVSAYVFTVADTTPAVIFLIYCLLISASDGFLKPLFLGRGMSTPMLVILLGAIGGMIMSGIIGLFIGAIVLALGYELFIAWLDDETVSQEQALEKS